MTIIKGKQKSERHHWWPESVSEHWNDGEGCAHWLLPDGEVRRSPAKNFGVIGNGHYIKLSKSPGENTVWDQNFEPIFNDADAAFPHVIKWLNSFCVSKNINEGKLSERFLPESATDDQLESLLKCIVSLAIRSPLNRQAAVGFAERIRGSIPERERNTLIAMNMRDSYKAALSAIGGRGKFALIYSPDREFIFGDGFCHNIQSPVQVTISNPKILVPLTPEISILFTRPMRYTVEPRFLKLIINAEEAGHLNNAVQIYSRTCLFYRSEAPLITSDYSGGQHLRFSDSLNPVDQMIAALPGVHSNTNIFF